MPVNPLFSHYGEEVEQNLLTDLTAESIQIMGQDMLYLPRTLFDKNKIFGEDIQSHFDNAIPIEVYIDFGGDSNFFGSADTNILSKFGLENRDRIILSVSKDRFQTLIGDGFDLQRPREGDLIYFPLNKKCFEIRFVNPFTMFYPLGATYVWNLTCELYEYSAQTFDTDVEEIDDLNDSSENMFSWAILTEDGRAILTESGDVLVVDDYDPPSIVPLDDSQQIQTESDNFLVLNEVNPYSANGVF